MKLSHYILALAMFLLTGGCEMDDEDAFAGKWVEVGRGNSYYPELTPSLAIVEFRPNGTYYGTLFEAIFF